MNVRNCRNCGRIFNYIAGPITCQSCREKLEAKFQDVKDYIRSHPGVGIPEVSEACEVDPSQIRQWLREDRLELTEDSPIRLMCEGCGEQIRSGKYCDRCKASMQSGFKQILDSAKTKDKAPGKQDKDKENPKMRFL